MDGDVNIASWKKNLINDNIYTYIYYHLDRIFQTITYGFIKR